MPSWENFFVAEAGAAAALAGLVFVGLSINMRKILANAALPDRAAQAVLLLFSILIVASILLVPGQPLWVVGFELLPTGLVIWYLTTRVSLRSLSAVDRQYFRAHATETAVVQAATLLYLGSAMVLLVWGGVGVYLLVPAFLVSFSVAMLDAWVLLVEINR